VPSSACTAIQARPFIATSRLRSVVVIGPALRSWPVVVSSAKARVEAPSPRMGTARKACSSARKPLLLALARLLESTSWRDIAAWAPLIDR